MNQNEYYTMKEMLINNNCPEEGMNIQTKEELMREIMCHEFAINDLALYLDTHSTDEKALKLHNKYCNDLNKVKNMYQKMYGPLTINYPCNSWRWRESPWPWEGSDC